MGLRGKRGKDRNPAGWTRDTIDGVYTADMLQADFLSLPPERRITIRASLEPKEHKVDSNTDIRLIINGLEQTKAIDIRATHSLPAHDDDEHDDDACIDGKE